MANVFTDLITDIYVGADVVAREAVGAVSGASINGDDKQRAAVGETIRVPVTPDATLVDVVPSMTTPEGTDQNIGNRDMTISKSKAVQIPWTGEDVRGMSNSGLYRTTLGDQVTQAMRALVNEQESDLCVEGYQNASRVTGVAGTTPFASDKKAINQLGKILTDNGCPLDMRTLVLDTSAGTNLRDIASLNDVSAAGSDQMLRNGVLGRLSGFDIRESAGIADHTQGTGSSYTTDTAGYAVGDTAITLITGSGTIVAGDVVSFAGDTNLYVADSFAGGVLTLQGPGLRVALAASAIAVTIGGDYAGNIAFRRNALELVSRAPALPEDGDNAVERETIQDPFSGLVFEIALYKGYKKSMLEVSAAWGVKAWKPEFIAGLMG